MFMEKRVVELTVDKAEGKGKEADPAMEPSEILR